jgi:alkylation response protein AidB-like acyl-CoA dehydrogenase
LEQFVVLDEVMRAGVPFPFVTVCTVGPALMRYGSEAQRRRYLPGALAGETIFAIGYTEPEAGTDLAALRTTARRDGDAWVINGAKLFTSGAGHADFVWLACRTGAPDSRHRGISIIVVPTDAPGFSWTPITTIGHPTAATYYDDVRAPFENLVGDLDGGWALMTSQLNHERVGLAAMGARALRAWDDTAAWSAVADDGAPAPIDISWIRNELARAYALLEGMRLVNRQTVGAAEPVAADAAVAKVLGTEATRDAFRILGALAGELGALCVSAAPPAALDGALERGAREAAINTFGGGVNEVLRDLIATEGLGLPRSRR